MFAPGERVSRDEGPARRSTLLLHRTGHEELGTCAEDVLGKVGLIPDSLSHKAIAHLICSIIYSQLALKVSDLQPSDLLFLYDLGLEIGSPQFLHTHMHFDSSDAGKW